MIGIDYPIMGYPQRHCQRCDNFFIWSIETCRGRGTLHVCRHCEMGWLETRQLNRRIEGRRCAPSAWEKNEHTPVSLA